MRRARRPPSGVWVAALLVAFAADVASAAPSARARIAAAQRAFRAARYRRVLSLLDPLPAAPRQAAEGAFLRAYARFKLGEHDEAERELVRATDPQLAPQVGLLRGMLALARKRWQAAQRALEPVAAAGIEPWAGSARQLLRRAREGVESARRAREEARRQAEARRYSDGIARAKRAIAAGQLLAARRQLLRLERRAPSRARHRYYLGLVAYRRRRYARAERLFASALARAPGDAWSRYMLALTHERRGRPAVARRELVALARGARDREVRASAARAAARLARLRPRSELTVALEAGAGVDSNPAYLDELPAAAESVGMAIEAAAELGYRRRLPRGFWVALAASARERAYAVAGESCEQTEVRARGAADWTRGAARLTGSYAFELAFYGHELLLTQHEGTLALGYRPRPWLELGLAGRFTARPVHDSDYLFLDAREVGGVLDAVLRRGRLLLRGGYALSRSWSDRATTPFAPRGQQSPKGHGTAGAAHLPSELRSDYTFWQHGPLLAAEVRLPWRLALTAAISLRWRTFDHGEALIAQDGSVTELDPRHDLRLSVAAELSRALPAGLAVVLRISSLDNFSSVADEALGVDRTYARRQATLAVRWRWSL